MTERGVFARNDGSGGVRGVSACNDGRSGVRGLETAGFFAMTEKAHVGFTDLESFTRLHVNILSVFIFGFCIWIAAFAMTT
jgi:hypothetical protein